MENENLKELKNRISMLPGLTDRLEKLRRKIYAAEDEEKELHDSLNKETHDVEQLKKDSFSATLLKLVNKYEGRLDKETQEELAAKMEYDRAAERVKKLKSEYEELGGRITELRQEKERYDEELHAREEEIQRNVGSEAYLEYKQLEDDRGELSRQLVEIDEAISAAKCVRMTADRAVQSLESAEDWATYDVWGGGGIFSHMAKYENIDDAEECFNVLSCQINDLREELADVCILDLPDVETIDSTTRAVDFWFDNIFTDMGVRDNIRNNIHEINELNSRIGMIIGRLEEKKSGINSQIAGLDQKRDELIINSKL